MTYFNKFPNTVFQNPDGSVSQVKDILRRVVFTDESYFQDSNYDKYVIRDNETPDMVAQKFYQDPNLHWIIILYNTLIDPFYTFPLSRTSFGSYIDKKYEGQAIFIRGYEVTEELPFFSTLGSFEQGDTISTRYEEDGVEKYNNKTQSAMIKRIDHSMSKLELFNQVGSNLVVGDAIVRRRTILESLKADVVKTLDSRFAPHHFEFTKSDGEKVILNPMATPPDADGNQTPLGSFYPFSDNTVDFSDTILHGFMYENDTTYVLTNESYEGRVNDARRRILIPKKFIVQRINQEFEKLMRK
jgi:hypothetical protein